MEELLRYIVIAIKSFWNDIAIIHDTKSIKYIDLFRNVIELSKSFNTPWIYRHVHCEDKKLRIALYANNSIEWITVFLATILSNNTLIIISPLTEIEEALHCLLSADILITDRNQDNGRKELNRLFLGVILDIESIIEPLSTKSIHINEVLRHSIRNATFGGKGDNVIIYTPNVLKEVKISFNKILVLLRELKNKEIFESKTEYPAYPQFSYNYILGMLLPLISNTIIIIPNRIAPFTEINYNFHFYVQSHKMPIIILSAHQFMQLYKEITEDHITFKEKLKVVISIRSYKSLFVIKELVINNRLHRIFPDIKKLIILNSSLPLHIEKILKKIKFPYTVTYGTVETCGIATYSHPSEHKIESVGKEIIGIYIIDNVIHYLTDSLNDLGIKDKDGNIYFISRTNNYTIQSRRIEDILKNIPFIKECIIRKSLKDKEEPYLLVRIDFEQAERMKISDEEEIKNIINSFIEKLDIPVSRILIWNKQFKYDHNDNIVEV